MGTLMLGITPTIFLHRIAANHTDAVDVLKKGYGNHFSKANFHCNLDNSVAQSPYIFFINAPAKQLVLICANPIALYKNNIYLSHNFYCELRGPPYC